MDLIAGRTSINHMHSMTSNHPKLAAGGSPPSERSPRYSWGGRDLAPHDYVNYRVSANLNETTSNVRISNGGQEVPHTPFCEGEPRGSMHIGCVSRKGVDSGSSLSGPEHHPGNPGLSHGDAAFLNKGLGTIRSGSSLQEQYSTNEKQSLLQKVGK
jgi:hypothetical protein